MEVAVVAPALIVMLVSLRKKSLKPESVPECASPTVVASVDEALRFAVTVLVVVPESPSVIEVVPVVVSVTVLAIAPVVALSTFEVGPAPAALLAKTL